jgi:hypothetical protein
MTALRFADLQKPAGSDAVCGFDRNESHTH